MFKIIQFPIKQCFQCFNAFKIFLSVHCEQKQEKYCFTVSVIVYIYRVTTSVSRYIRLVQQLNKTKGKSANSETQQQKHNTEGQQ